MATFFLCLMILLLPLHTFAQNTANIPIGASITADDTSTPWLSPSGNFAFGFQQLPGNPDFFVLSIWFDKIPDKTIVWHERAVYPVRRGSTVQLDAASGIVLRGPHGRVLHSSDGLADQVAFGFLNDTGNFVLRSSGSASLWESFNNPTDTILPAQTIQPNGGLISHATATNFSQGRFYARMKGDGNFALSTKSVPTNTLFDVDYYTTGISGGNGSNWLIFDERGVLSVQAINGTQVLLSSQSDPPASDNYYRATLDFDGIFVLYYHPKNFSGNNPGWATAGSWPDNICINIAAKVGSGACGYNSVCSVEKGRPVCQCPKGYSLVDPNNTYADCRPNYVQSCIQEGSPEDDEYDMLEIADVDWPLTDYQKIEPSTMEVCRGLCLSDCFCAVVIFRSNACWKKRLPLSNGVADASLNTTAFLKLKKGNTSSLDPNSLTPVKRRHKYRKLARVEAGLLGTSVFVNFLLIGVGCLGYFFVYKKKASLNPVLDTSVSNLRSFTLKELVQATNGFKEEVGRGSFGIVYKGVISNGSKRVVAVKKLDRVAQDSEKEFKAEVNVIGQTHHKHLVCLIGFCDEGSHRLLVYEYMSNGTLASFLFSDLRPNWSQRTQLALEVARGLTYLHEECSTQIIHCDIKPQNILLDEYYNARISDFGLAKILKMNESRTLTNVRGTKGYLAPEWYRNKPVTVKVDVYSFGVLLLEIITCKRNVDPKLDLGNEENPILTDWVWDCFMEGRVDLLVENDEEALSNRVMLERYVMVGIWCIQEDAWLRPTMRKACQMLEGVIGVEVPPCPYRQLSTC